MTDCFWLYSSGSTGHPRASFISIGTWSLPANDTDAGCGIEPDDIVFCASKLFFSFGFGGGMTFPLWVGASIVVQPERATAEFPLDYLERSGATVFFGVPTLYGQMVHALRETATPSQRIATLSLRRRSLAGHDLQPLERLTGVSILDGIGSTEVLHIFVSNRIDDILPGTSGRPVPGYEVKIVGEDGNVVPTARSERFW